ncbi:MAG TPA: CAP domain-containing protein, partial [Thermoanaerobaculia bacterium]|nr:CAP domain-containing protein [Thermoanaerobaculia bacterium]
MKYALLAAAIVLLASPVAHSEMDETRATLRTHVLKLINRDRQLYNLPPVQLDLAASAIGDAYCVEQIRTGTNGHYGTDGLTPYMRYSFGGGNDGVSENAAAWSATYAFSERALYEMARRSQDAMMAEMPPKDGHKKTILDPHATHVGIGLAWERGEFRLVHEFIRRHVQWTRTLPRRAFTTDTPIIAGRPLDGASIEAISVHHEPMPETMPAHVANAIESYSLPNERKDYLPRLKQEYTRHANGTIEIVRREYSNGHRGDFYVGKQGEFSFAIPFTEGPGVYTVVVWVRRPGYATPVAASNISIRVEES